MVGDSEKVSYFCPDLARVTGSFSNELASFGITYVVHGGVAAIYYGGRESPTEDLDVWVDSGGVARLAEAEGRPLVVAQGGYANFKIIRAKTERDGNAIELGELSYRADRKAEYRSYFEVGDTAETAEMGGASVRIVSVNDLIASYLSSSTNRKRKELGKSERDRETALRLLESNPAHINPEKIAKRLGYFDLGLQTFSDDPCFAEFFGRAD